MKYLIETMTSEQVIGLLVAILFLGIFIGMIVELFLSRIGNGKVIDWQRLKEGGYRVEYIHKMEGYDIASWRNQRLLVTPVGPQTNMYYGSQILWIGIPYHLVSDVEVRDVIIIERKEIKVIEKDY